VTSKRLATKSARRPKAYSYIRFSTPEQAEGHSLRRQTEAARAYCERTGLELDLSLRLEDAGVSAFRGGNITEDKALGGFLRMVQDGIVKPGAYLIVESLDRISRQTVHLAVATMQTIIASGIIVVDLSDGNRVYSTETFETDKTAFLMMAIRFMRANEESALKSQRLLSKWADKRVELKNPKASKPFTSMLPGWLAWDETKCKVVVTPKRAALLRTIFKRAMQAGASTALHIGSIRREPRRGARGSVKRRTGIVPTFRNF
jgi:DNA invertase Pin-like site-specific DNA recombinase